MSFRFLTREACYMPCQPQLTLSHHSDNILQVQVMKHICAIYSSLLLKQSSYLTENEIIAIFWGECISSYGWRRDPAPLCGKGARFVPAINNEHAIVLSPMHNLHQTPTIPANKPLRKPKTKQQCSQPKPEGQKLSTKAQSIWMRCQNMQVSTLTSAVKSWENLWIDTDSLYYKENVFKMLLCNFTHLITVGFAET